MFKFVPNVELILASASPRRYELLSAIGLEFKVIVSNCPEEQAAKESAQQMVERLAFDKAAHVAAHHPSAWVLGADTSVVVAEDILGKPHDNAEACRMLGALQGREHTVWGAFCLFCVERKVQHVESHKSLVGIRSMSAELIEEYVSSGEPMDKAGAYAIQGLGAALVQHVRGSYTNVVGLNLAATVAAFEKHGLLD